MTDEPLGYCDIPLVDTHSHIFDCDMPFVASAWTRPDYAYTAETYIETLDQYGVSYGVVAAASLFGTYNDYVIAALRRHPRLKATANVDPGIDGYTLARMREDGITGIRLQLLTHTDLSFLADDDHLRLFRRLRDLDMHVHFLIDGAYTQLVLDHLCKTGVKIVLDHFGWPAASTSDADHVDMIARAAERSAIWVKLSAGFRFDDPDRPRNLAKLLVERLGAHRLFWGSDAPYAGHEGETDFARAIATFCDWLPDPNHRRAVSEASLAFYFPELTRAAPE